MPRVRKIDPPPGRQPLERQRQQLIISEQARDRLRALAPIYGDMSRAAEVAIERLWRADLDVEMPDAVLELVRKQLRMALAGIEGELERRAEMGDHDAG